jgi:adenylyl-sulfate kinase
MSTQGSAQEVAPKKPLKHKGFCLWFTGLSGAGKSTISMELSKILHDKSAKFEILDGDEVRENLSKGLGFSREDRDTNIRRIGYVCHLLSRNGVITMSAAISPYKSVRDENRKMIGDFVEIFVDCPLEVVIERDVKGLYKKALSGEIKNFTGVSDPYEAPENPEIVVKTHEETVEESAQKIIRYLEENQWIEST